MSIYLNSVSSQTVVIKDINSKKEIKFEGPVEFYPNGLVKEGCFAKEYVMDGKKYNIQPIITSLSKSSTWAGKRRLLSDILF